MKNKIGMSLIVGSFFSFFTISSLSFATDFPGKIVHSVFNAYGPENKTIEIKNVDVCETHSSIMGYHPHTSRFLDIYLWVKGVFDFHTTQVPHISVVDKNYPDRWSHHVFQFSDLFYGSKHSARRAFVGIDAANPGYGVFEISHLEVPQNENFCVDLYAVYDRPYEDRVYSNQENPNAFFRVCY